MKVTATTHLEHIGTYGNYDIYLTDCTIYKQYVVLPTFVEPTADNIVEGNQCETLELTIDSILISTLRNARGYDNITTTTTFVYDCEDEEDEEVDMEEYDADSEIWEEMSELQQRISELEQRGNE